MNEPFLPGRPGDRTPIGDCASRDLASSRTGLVVWGLPALVGLAGVALAGARPVLWTVGFLAAGAACLANARRCGRRHCYVTGPLYLALSAASALVGVGVLSWSWWWLGVAWGAGTLLAFVAELRGQRYREGRPLVDGQG